MHLQVSNPHSRRPPGSHRRAVRDDYDGQYCVFRAQLCLGYFCLCRRRRCHVFSSFRGEASREVRTACNADQEHRIAGGLSGRLWAPPLPRPDTALPDALDGTRTGTLARRFDQLFRGAAVIDRDRIRRQIGERILKIPCDCLKPCGDPFAGNMALHIAHASQRFLQTEPHL